jgi:hypothetical protein
MSLSESLIRIGLTSSEVAELLGNSRGNAIIDMSSGHDLRAVDDNGVVRVIMSAPSLLVEFGTDCNFAAFNSSGVIQFYVDADTGKLYSGNSFIGRLNLLFSGSKSPLVIDGGIITITGSYHDVTTEGGAASDNLDTINGGVSGDVLILSSSNDAANVVLKDNTGNLKLAGDCTLDHTTDKIMLFCQSNGNWEELTRSINGA